MRIVGSIGLYRHALSEVPRSQIPENLRPFLNVEDFQSNIEILKLDSHELSIQAVKNAVSNFVQIGKGKSNWWKREEYPPVSVLWPNPILHNARLAPRSSSPKDTARLAALCKLSSSHGISWDALDDLYINFVKARDSAIEKWQESEPQIIDFAFKITKNWIVEWRMEKLGDLERLKETFTEDEIEKLKCPPTVQEKWVRILVKRWKDRYLDIYSPGMLSKYLKGHVTLAMLKRESSETGESTTNLEFVPDKRNPCFKKPVENGKSFEGDFWDVTGLANTVK